MDIKEILEKLFEEIPGLQKYSTEPGSNINDLFLKPLQSFAEDKLISGVLATEGESLDLGNYKSLTYQQLSRLARNHLINEQLDNKSIGYIDLYFIEPVDWNISEGTKVYSDRIEFTVSADINLSAVESMYDREDGYYVYRSLPVENEAGENISANSLSNMEGAPAELIKITHSAINNGTSIYTNSELYGLIKRSRSKYQLINSDGIYRIVKRKFPSLADALVVGAGDKLMQRDKVFNTLFSSSSEKMISNFEGKVRGLDEPTASRLYVLYQKTSDLDSAIIPLNSQEISQIDYNSIGKQNLGDTSVFSNEFILNEQFNRSNERIDIIKDVTEDIAVGEYIVYVDDVAAFNTGDVVSVIDIEQEGHSERKTVDKVEDSYNTAGMNIITAGGPPTSVDIYVEDEIDPIPDTVLLANTSGSVKDEYTVDKENAEYIENVDDVFFHRNSFSKIYKLEKDGHFYHIIINSGEIIFKEFSAGSSDVASIQLNKKINDIAIQPDGNYLHVVCNETYHKYNIMVLGAISETRTLEVGGQRIIQSGDYVYITNKNGYVIKATHTGEIIVERKRVTGVPKDMIKFGDYLYVGYQSGKVEKVSTTLDTIEKYMDTSPVNAMELYNDHIYLGTSDGLEVISLESGTLVSDNSTYAITDLQIVEPGGGEKRAVCANGEKGITFSNITDPDNPLVSHNHPAARGELLSVAVEEGGDMLVVAGTGGLLKYNEASGYTDSIIELNTAPAVEVLGQEIADMFVVDKTYKFSSNDNSVDRNFTVRHVSNSGGNTIIIIPEDDNWPDCANGSIVLSPGITSIPIDDPATFDDEQEYKQLILQYLKTSTPFALGYTLNAEEDNIKVQRIDSQGYYIGPGWIKSEHGLGLGETVRDNEVRVEHRQLVIGNNEQNYSLPLYKLIENNGLGLFSESVKASLRTEGLDNKEIELLENLDFNFNKFKENYTSADSFLTQFNPIIQRKLDYHNNIVITGEFSTDFDPSVSANKAGYSHITVLKSSTGKASATDGYGIAWRPSAASSSRLAVSLDGTTLTPSGWTVSSYFSENDTYAYVSTVKNNKTYWLPFNFTVNTDNGTLDNCEFPDNVDTASITHISIGADNVFLVDNDLVRGSETEGGMLYDTPQGMLSYISSTRAQIEPNTTYAFRIEISQDYGVKFYVEEAPVASWQAIDPVLTEGARLPLCVYNQTPNKTHFGISVVGTGNSEWYYDSIKVATLEELTTTLYGEIDCEQMPDELNLEVDGVGYGNLNNTTTYGIEAFLFNPTTYGWDRILYDKSESVQPIISKTFNRDKYIDNNFIKLKISSQYPSHKEMIPSSGLEINYLGIRGDFNKSVNIGGCVDVYLEDNSLITATETDVEIDTTNYINGLDLGRAICYISGVSLTDNGQPLTEGVDYIYFMNDDDYEGSTTGSLWIKFRAGLSGKVDIEYVFSPLVKMVSDWADNSMYAFYGQDMLFKHKIIHRLSVNASIIMENNTSTDINSLVRTYLNNLEMSSEQYTLDYNRILEYLYGNGVETVNRFTITDIYHKNGDIYQKTIDSGGDTITIDKNEVFKLEIDV